MKPLITNIQRFCVHDGPGIRTTVFFKGCSLHCPWCANPENISVNEEYYYIKEKCMNQCKYVQSCNAKNKREILDSDLNLCTYKAVGRFGRYYTAEELYDELIKDIAFYRNGGGVTFSGGEALLFLPEYEDVTKKLYEKGITVCVETALMVPEQNCRWAVENIDYFFVDIKLIDKIQCRSVLGGDLDLFVKNLEYIHNAIPKSRLTYRIPLVLGITYTEENISAIQELIIQYPVEHVEIFSVHNLGEKKYERLGKKYQPFERLKEEQLLDVQKRLSEKGIEVSINSL